MGFNCGIVGLPNVGKSTLFNALTKTMMAEASNYAFCTIDPNTGRVSVPDERLDIIAKIGGSAKTIPTQLEFVDIAGLVKGAAQGEGLGNKFLSNIREVDAIIHVLRCFEDADIMHVAGHVDPIRDAEIVETELLLADLESLERQQYNLGKRARAQEKEAIALLALLEVIKKGLEDGHSARSVLDKIETKDQKLVKQLNLLTAKPILYVCNVEESAAATGNEFSRKVEEMAKQKGAKSVFISANIESEIAQLTDLQEQKEFIETLGLPEAGLNKIIRTGYELLDLITFFTVGPKEARAWTLTKNSKAPQAAGVIHTDFEKGFIKAETTAYNDYVAAGGEAAAKEQGKVRQEGKEYVVQDGDIMLFKFNN